MKSISYQYSNIHCIVNIKLHIEQENNVCTMNTDGKKGSIKTELFQ